MLCFYLLKGKKNITYNKEIAFKNEELQKENEILTNENQSLKLDSLNLKGNIKFLESKREETQKSIILIEEQAKQAGEVIYKQSKQIAEKEFELSTENMRIEFEKNKKQCEEEYFNLMEELAQQTAETIKQHQDTLSLLEQKINDQTSIVNAAIQANKRTLEENNKKEFYKIQLSDTDKNEIEKLRSIIPYLRNEEPLNKIIWKTYYEKPTSDLIGRLIGTENKIGIYKITNLNNQMCYIGQSVNIADRFKTHIKAGLGIDGSNNKLYTAMKSDKVENFSFEILEECDRTQLNEKEKFWIKYYQSETFGYNMTRGNK